MDFLNLGKQQKSQAGRFRGGGRAEEEGRNESAAKKTEQLFHLHLLLFPQISFLSLHSVESSSLLQALAFPPEVRVVRRLENEYLNF